MLIARLYNHYREQKVFAQREIVSKITIEEKIDSFWVAKMEIPITPGLDTGVKIELYEVGNKEDQLIFRGIVYEIKPVRQRWDMLEITVRWEESIFQKRKTLRKHTFTALPLSTIIKKLIDPYNSEFNEDWGFEIQKDEILTLEIEQWDDYADIFDEICKQKELFWRVVDGVIFFRKNGEDLRSTQLLEYDGCSANPGNIIAIELVGTSSGGNVALIEDSKWRITVDKSQYSWLLTGVVSKQVRKGDDNEKAKQFAKEQARPQRKYQIQVANSSIIANLWDRIKVEVVNTNSFYDYSGEAIVQSKTTSYSNASKVVVYGIQEFLVSPFSAENRVENVEKSIKLLRQRKGGGETPPPQADLSWYATSSAVNQAIQSQNTKIEQKADSSFVQWVAQTAQTALNAANQAKQTADGKANDSDVVHKGWSETVDWAKTFSGWLALLDNKIYFRSHWDNNHFIQFDPSAWNGANWVKIHEIGGFTFSTSHWDKIKFTEQGNINFMNSEVELTIKDLTLSKHNPRETQTISQYAKATNWTPWGIHFVDYVAATPNWLTNWGKELRGYLHIGDGVRTFDKFQVRGYEWFDWNEASLANARKYIKLDAPKILLWDEDILGEWKSWTPSSAYNVNEVVNHSCKYKLIGRTLMICWNVMLKVWGTQEFAITLPHSVLDSSWAVELRWPWSFQFTRGYCQCVWWSLWFHSWDNNIPVNQNIVLRFSAILQTI